MKPLVLVTIALLGFTGVALAQNNNGDRMPNAGDRQAPMDSPRSPVGSPCGAGPTTASLVVSDKTPAATPMRDGATVADLQCAGNDTPIRTDAPASTTAAIAPDGK